MTSWNSSFSGGYRSYSISEADGFADAVALGIILGFVMLILSFWALVKAMDLVIRAWRQCHGKSRALRIALFSWLTLSALILVSGLATLQATHSADTSNNAGSAALSIVIGVAVLFGLSTIVLLVTAHYVELEYRQTFLSEPATLISRVLHQPWWTTTANQAP